MKEHLSLNMGMIFLTGPLPLPIKKELCHKSTYFELVESSLTSEDSLQIVNLSCRKTFLIGMFASLVLMRSGMSVGSFFVESTVASDIWDCVRPSCEGFVGSGEYKLWLIVKEDSLHVEF